ncbi:protein-tyrosine phosphatase-like protein [Sporodiniella umbellata]|nr:protein-tyrosine phosphatase-like protein [Sporodiniella umbellata]
MALLTSNRLSVSTSSGLASRRKHNKKNLSLSLSSSQSSPLCDIPKTATFIPQDQNTNAYPQGPVQIMPYLFLGSEKNAQQVDPSGSIQAILNVAVEVNPLDESRYQSMDDLISAAIAPSPSLSKASTISTGSSLMEEEMVDDPPNHLIGYHKLPWEHNQENLVAELQKAVAIIDQARSANQTILVHCQCGVARSATVVIAYVMKSMKLPMQEAYDLVKSLSPVISPNLTLLFQLREYEQSLLSKKLKKSDSNAISFKHHLPWKSRLTTKSLFSKK